MKNVLLPTLLLMFMLFSVLTNAQNSTVKKTMLIKNDGLVYINKDLPVYLWISNSADNNSEKLLLKGAGEHSNPFYFDTEGINSIHTPWKVHSETKQYILPKQDVLFHVQADGKSPNTNSDLSGAPEYYASGIKYYGKNLSLTLQSKDAVSGVEKTFVTINGAGTTEYNSPINLNKEGSTKIGYYATDIVGNVEATKSLEFTIDITAPEIEMEITGPQISGIIGPKNRIVITSKDNLSGVKRIYYSFDGKTKKVYTGPISFAGMTEGSHKFDFWSIDNVKNSNKDNPKNSNIDLEYDFSAPDISHEIVGDYYKGSYRFVSPRSKFKIITSDKNGIKETKYGNQVMPNIDYTEPFLFSSKKGTQTINYYAIDKLENKTRLKKEYLYLDAVLPVTGIDYKVPQFFNRDTLFINKNTKIQLFATDKESGVLKIEYSIDNKDNFKEFSTFTIPEDGFHTIYFKSTDKVNNVEEIKESSCLVDNSSPIIYINYSINTIGKKMKDGKEYQAYPEYTKIYISATDKWSGTESIYYSINGGPKRLYISAKDIQARKYINKPGFYEVKIIAIDKLGNQND